MMMSGMMMITIVLDEEASPPRLLRCAGSFNVRDCVVWSPLYTRHTVTLDARLYGVMSLSSERMSVAVCSSGCVLNGYVALSSSLYVN